MTFRYDPYNCPLWFRQALEAFVERATEEEMERLK